VFVSQNKIFHHSHFSVAKPRAQTPIHASKEGGAPRPFKLFRPTTAFVPRKKQDAKTDLRRISPSDRSDYERVSTEQGVGLDSSRKETPLKACSSLGVRPRRGSLFGGKKFSRAGSRAESRLTTRGGSIQHNLSRQHFQESKASRLFVGGTKAAMGKRYFPAHG